MKNKTKLILILIVLFLSCVAFTSNPSIWNAKEISKMQNATADDFEITITDYNSVVIENLIELNGIKYSWIIHNTIDGVDIINDEILPLYENKSIELTFQNIEDVIFSSIILYEDKLYTSNQFKIDENGELYLFLQNSTTTRNDVSARDVNDIVSLAYLCFLIASVFLFYLVRKKHQWIILLCSSIVFYLLSDISHIVMLLISSVIVFFSANIISKHRLFYEEKIDKETDKKIKSALKQDMQKCIKEYFITALFSVVFLLITIKYTAFFEENINNLFEINVDFIDFVAPLGLSFYTFIILGYLIDVYRGKYQSEKNFMKFFLFVSFFPHISQGPLSRHNELSSQFFEEKTFNYSNFCFGMQRILWGFFIKLVLSDKLSVITDEIFANYMSYSWVMLILGTFIFSIQIYTDFYSSMEIAIGSAQLFGIKLTENFMRPYFSTTMPEFWRRWHISLGSWFKDYVFYPISINKKMLKFNVWLRKKSNNYIAMVITSIPPILGVWLLTGFWHGASWAFIAWGLYHGILILLSVAFSSQVQTLLKKFKIKTDTIDYKFFQMIKVFVLCSIGRVFFKTNSLRVSIEIFKIIFSGKTTTQLFDFSNIALNTNDYYVIAISFVALLTVSIIQENKKSVREVIANTNLVLRWGIWLALIITIIIFGMYGLGTSTVFIYEAF